MKAFGFTAALAAIVLIIFVLPSIRIIGPTQVGVVTRFGNIVGTLDSGVAWQFWVTDNVTRFDLTMRDTRLNFAARSVDAQAIDGNLIVQWQLQPQHAEQIIREFGSVTALEDRIQSAFMDNTLRAFGRNNAMFAVEHREALRADLEHAMREAAPDFRIVVQNVHLGELRFSPIFNDAVDARIRAEQEAERAVAEARANVTAAQGRRDVAYAEGQAVRYLAQADADALRIMAEAWDDPEIREIMLLQKMIEQWSGNLPLVVGGDSPGVLVDLFNSIETGR